ncbi:kinase-like domain-containing protein [Mycena leptocephala]|nr:kinase-like domain-containing protein [Mycena leptocephala]
MPQHNTGSSLGDAQDAPSPNKSPGPHPQRSEPKPQATFLTKLYALLEGQDNHHMIRWDPQGKHIIVERPKQLALHILPSIFHQFRFASFSRQLNIYGFVRNVKLSDADPAIDDPAASTWSHATLDRHSPPEVVANFKRLPKPRKHVPRDSPSLPPPSPSSFSSKSSLTGKSINMSSSVEESDILHALGRKRSDDISPVSARRPNLRKSRSNLSTASSGRDSSWLSGYSDAASDDSSLGSSLVPDHSDSRGEWNGPSYDLHSHQLILQNLDLTGKIKLDRYPFESGNRADIYQGRMNSSGSSITAGSPFSNGQYTARKVAVKIFRRMHSDREWLERTSKSLYKEARIWRQLDHPNILPFWGIALDLGLSPALISPYYASGPIMKYFQNHAKDPKDKLEMVIGVANGLAYLHSKEIIHGSLCTKKVLIDADSLPVICGYGTSKTAVNQPPNSTSLFPTPIRFTSPECLSAGNSAHTVSADIYAFSMVMLEILSGLPPYHHLPSEHAVFMHVLRGERPIRTHLDPQTFTTRIWQFLTSLWDENPYSTLKMSDVARDLIQIRDSGSDSNLDEDIHSASPQSTHEFHRREREVNSSSGEETWFGDSSLPDIHGRGLEGRVTQDDQYPFAGGGNSNIYRGKLTRSDGRKIRVAIKMIRASDDGSGHLDDILRRLKREVDVWRRLRHKNILPFIGVCDDVAPFPVLISPFYKFGHVGTYLKKHPTVDRNELVCGVASGLQFLHRYDVIHGDLKVHNVLVDKRGAPCICDFGISRIINHGGFTTSTVGTAPYMAPELFFVVDGNTRATPCITKGSDVYSFGLLVLENIQILTSEPPKGRPNRQIVTVKLLEALHPNRADYDIHKVTNTTWSVLDQCWAFDPQLRPTIAEVLPLLRQSWSPDGNSGSVDR